MCIGFVIIKRYFWTLKLEAYKLKMREKWIPKSKIGIIWNAEQETK